MIRKIFKLLRLYIFSFSKLLKIHPKAFRTRMNEGSLKGQLNIFIELSFFYDATTLFNTEKMEQCFIENSGSNFFNRQIVIFRKYRTNNFLSVFKTQIVSL